jgi:hypothetical protein
VAFVREVTGLPPTATWRRGDPVRGGDFPAGTAIATFDPNGRYGNHVDGRSHTAILLAETSDGLLVTDQWVGQEVHQRMLRFRAGKGDACNDGDQYYAVEIHGATATD